MICVDGAVDGEPIPEPEAQPGVEVRVAVNVRGRVPSIALDSDRNQMSQVMVAARAKELADHDELLRGLARQRRGQLERGMDVLSWRLANRSPRQMRRSRCPFRRRTL